MSQQFITPEDINSVYQMDGALIKVDKSVTGLIKHIDSLNSAFNTTKESSKEANKKTEEYATILNKAAESSNKLSQNAKILETQQKQLATTQAKIATANTKTNKTLIEQRIELQKVNKATKDKIIAQKAEKGSIEQLSAVNRILEARLRGVGTATEAARKKADTLRSAIDKNNKKITEQSSSLNKQRRNIGNYGSAFDSLGGKFPMVTGGIRKVNIAFKLLAANPIVAVIALIVGAFIGLVKIFKDTDEGGTKIEAMFNGLKAIADVLKNRLLDLGNAVKLLFSGKRKEAAEEYKKAVNGVGDAIGEAYNQANDYVVKLDELDDRMTGSISSQAKVLKNFREYIALSKDQTTSDEERLENLNKAQKAAEEYFGNIREWEKERYDLEIQNAAARINLTEEELAAFIELDGNRQEELRNSNETYRDAWNKLGDETIKGLEQQYAKMDEADTQYFKRTSEITSLRSGLLKKINADELKAIDDIKKAQEQIKLTDPVTINDIVDFEDDSFLPEPEEIDEEAKALFEAIENEQARSYERRKMIAEANGMSMLDFDKMILEEQLSSIENLIDSEALAEEEKIRLKNEASNIRIDLDKIETDKEIENQDKILAKREFVQQKSIELAQLGFDFVSALYDRQLADIEEKNKAGLLSDEEAARKTAEIQRKQAIADKVAALFNIAINTAIAATKVTAQTGLGAALAIPLVIAGGALQAAAVLAKPIPEVPAFLEGTGGKFSTPSTFTIAEDGKTELLTLKTGEIQQYDKPTLLSGNKFKGAKVTSNPELEYVKSQTLHSGFTNNFSDSNIISKLGEKLDSVEKAIKNQPQPIYNRNGSNIGYKKNGNETINLAKLRQ